MKAEGGSDMARSVAAACAVLLWTRADNSRFTGARAAAGMYAGTAQQDSLDGASAR